MERMESEKVIDQRIREYQKLFGIVEEGEIVDAEDYEKTMLFEDEDVASMRKSV